MKIDGSYPFSAPQDAVWSALQDPDVLANILPGCEKLQKIDENEYRATMRIRIGPVQGLFNGTVQLSDLRPPEGFHLDVDGKGAPGFVKGSGDLRLEDQGQSTLLHYSGDAQVGGRLASVGQRLMESSAQALIRQSLEGLEAQVTARLQGEEGAAPAPIAAPTQMEFAAGVTKKMIEDMLPAEKRPELLQLGLALLAGFIVLRAIANWWIDRLAYRVADVLEDRQRRG